MPSRDSVNIDLGRGRFLAEYALPETQFHEATGIRSAAQCLRPHRFRVLFTGLSALVVWAPVPAASLETSGLSLIAVRARDLILFLTISCALLLLGLSLIARLRAQRQAAGMELAAAYVIGQGVLGGALLLIGLAGLFDPVILRVLFVAVCALVASELTVQRFAAQVRGTGLLVRELASSGWGRALCVGVGLVLLMLLVSSLGPLVTWDGPMYHVDLPVEYLQRGRIYLPDDNLHAAYIAAPQVISAIPLTLMTPAYLAFSQFASFALLLVAVAGAMRSWVSLNASRFVVLLLISSTGLLYASDYDKVDLSLVVAVVVTLLWVVAADLSREPAYLSVVGLLAGGALLTKYHAIPFLIGVAAVLAWQVMIRRVAVTGHDAALGLTLGTLLFAPFLLKNWMLFGAPLYPFLTERIPYPWLENLGLELPNGLHGGFSITDRAREPFDFLDYILSPAALTVESQGVWFGFPAIYLLGFGALWTRHRALAVQLLVPCIAGVGLILAVTTSINLRYFLPIFPLLAMLSALTISSVLPDRLTSLGRLLVGLVVVAALAMPVKLLATNVLMSGRLQIGAGIEATSEWLERPELASNRRVRELGSYLSTGEFASRGRILLIHEARGYHLGPDVIQDNGHNSWLMLSESLGGRCLDPGKVSHVVVDTVSLRYLEQRGLTSTELGTEAFNEFAATCLYELGYVAGYTIFSTVQPGLWRGT